jgi:NAD(P)-dependent dehydrogenase (short-subunit alcohol dehydrogenase family)
LAAAGAHVTITTRHDDDGRDAVKVISAIGSVDLVVVDLADESGVDTVADAILAGGDELHILVNNAGVTWGAPFEEYPASAWDKVLGLDVAIPFRLLQALLPRLVAAATADDPARVVNLGSIDGHAVGGFDNFAYSAAKAGIHHLTRVLAYRLGPHRITVNCVAPSPTPTRMTSALLDAHERDLVDRHPLGRLCRPDDIAGALLYLVGPTAGFVTGAVLPVDGGLSLSPWWPVASIRAGEPPQST